MAYTKRIVCLANSVKFGGSCIAGRELEGTSLGAWIRPVSNREYQEILPDDRKFRNGAEPKLLDIIDVPMLEPCPDSCHTENHLVDISRYWAKVGEFRASDLPSICERPNRLWKNDSSSWGGANDRVSESEANTLKSSLVVIQPVDLTVRVVMRDYEGRTRKQVRASFRFNRDSYDLVVTDPDIRTLYRASDPADYLIHDPSVVCISLSEIYPDGYRYKLVASVISLGS